MTRLWLVCYDISDDKRRTKLAKLLEQHCQRVQHSVFECPLETNILSHLLATRWLPILKVSEDNLRVYPLNAIAKQQVRVYGSAEPYEPPDYLIL